MSDRSKIEWTDASWNPVTGCTKVSAGCDHCYAETFAERWRGTPGHHFERGFDLTLRPERLGQPLRWTKPRRVFVNSMSDLFHDDIHDDFIAKVFAVMALTPRHTYQVLTKRHGRMRAFLSNPDVQVAIAMAALEFDDVILGGRWPLPNVWLGVSVEDQKWADIRIPALLETPLAVHWISCEPLLGPVDLSPWLSTGPMCGCGVSPEGAPHAGACSPACMTPEPSGIDWVVVGGESGRGARPTHPRWAEALRDQCRSAGVPFFFKQWGEWSPLAPLDRQGRFNFDGAHALANDGTLYEPGALSYPDGQRYGEAIRAGHDKAHLTNMYHVGKRAAGRELDGRTWDEYPS